MLVSHPNLRQAMPEEAPLPTPEEPVIVPDYYFTSAGPITDRSVVTDAIGDLAKNVKQALDNDLRCNSRYARRLRLENTTKICGKMSRTEFLIPLPICESCWNDLDEEMIEFYIVKTLLAQVVDDQYLWFGLRMLVDDFMDSDTKEYMDKLDQGEALDDIKRTVSYQMQSPAKTPQPAQCTTTPEIEHQPSTSTGTSTSVPSVEPQLITISDDDDDDVIFLD